MKIQFNPFSIYRSEFPLQLGQWHTIRVSRTARLAVLRVSFELEFKYWFLLIIFHSHPFSIHPSHLPTIAARSLSVDPEWK